MHIRTYVGTYRSSKYYMEIVRVILTDISVYLSVYLSIYPYRNLGLPLATELFTKEHVNKIHQVVHREHGDGSLFGKLCSQKKPYMYHMSRLDYGNCLHIVRCLYTQAYESQRFPGTLDPQAFATGSTNKEVNYIARNTPYGRNREDASHGC